MHEGRDSLASVSGPLKTQKRPLEYLLASQLRSAAVDALAALDSGTVTSNRADARGGQRCLHFDPACPSAFCKTKSYSGPFSISEQLTTAENRMLNALT